MSPIGDARGLRTLRRAGRALVDWQISRPTSLLGFALLTLVIAVWGASQLTLKTSFGELLPHGKESVQVAEMVNRRLPSASTLNIVAEGSDPAALKRFVDALAPEIRALGPEMVGAVDDGDRETRAFFAKNRLLYAPLADIESAHAELVERFDYEVTKRAGMDLGLEEPPAPLTADRLRERFAKHESKGASTGADLDGYYMEPSGRMIAVLVRTPVSSGDLERSSALLGCIDDIIARLDPKRFDATMTVRYAGDFITSAQEYAQIKDDLGEVGLAGVLMIFAVVFCFYLRVRTLLAMVLTVLVGVLWTFGVAYLTIGHLNSSTGFLVSIVVGNGINFGIIYMTRYLEERRTAGLADSIRAAHRETWLSTLAGAGAAMVAYGSLVVTDFRGFKHFGLIGGSGMILCWCATYLFLPAWLVVFEKFWPIETESPLAMRLRGAYGRPFAFLARRLPRAVALGGVAAGLVALGLAVRYIASDPMEYNMANIRTEAQLQTDTRTLSQRVGKVVGRAGQDGLAIAVDRIEQVLPLKAALEERRVRASEGHKPFEKVVTVFDILPSDQARKLELLTDIKDRFERGRRRGFFSEEQWAEIAKVVPDELSPVRIEDLPSQVARSFEERDGTRGRLVYIVPTVGRSVWDARYLIEWADSFRTTRLPDGSVIKGSGRAVIFADLILTVLEDTPKAIAVSFCGTVLIILFAFRGRKASWAVLGTLLLGITWMLAFLAVYKSQVSFRGMSLPEIRIEGLKLNFLNFVALPVSLGIGADYAINIMQRYGFTGPGQAPRVVEATGGAVILCSLTAVLGYAALTFSVNRAIASFGLAAAAGEIGCLFAGVLVLPACLEWRDRRRAETGAPLA